MTSPKEIKQIKFVERRPKKIDTKVNLISSAWKSYLLAILIFTIRRSIVSFEIVGIFLVAIRFDRGIFAFRIGCGLQLTQTNATFSTVSEQCEKKPHVIHIKYCPHIIHVE